MARGRSTAGSTIPFETSQPAERANFRDEEILARLSCPCFHASLNWKRGSGLATHQHIEGELLGRSEAWRHRDSMEAEWIVIRTRETAVTRDAAPEPGLSDSVPICLEQVPWLPVRIGE